jgi:CMP-N,N'-diacetyllegionaminic acid synthase
MKILYVIPARAGSNGVPGKNYKPLNNKPLIEYSIDFALSNMVAGDELCVSTNDADVVKILNKKGIILPFIRPEELSTDTAGSYEVLLHSLRHYKDQGKEFDALLLLQPTSPFRAKEDFDKVMSAYDDDCDMVVTVKLCKDSPYFNLFEENREGYLQKSKDGDFVNRQSAPAVYAYNGSIYLIRISSLLQSRLNEFRKIKKVVMPAERSIDIDTPEDWYLAEYLSKSDPNKANEREGGLI